MTVKAPHLTSSLLLRKGRAAPTSVHGPQKTHGPQTSGIGPIPLRSVEGTPPPAFASTWRRETRPNQDPAEAKRPSARTDQFGRVRVSLRLDPERHLKMKLAAAHARQSLQDFLISALDRHLDQIAESVAAGKCGCLTRDKGHQAPSDRCYRPRARQDTENEGGTE